MSGWQMLGNAMGGGVETAKNDAYLEGQHIGAKTQNALAQARTRRIEEAQKMQQYEAMKNAQESLIQMFGLDADTAAGGAGLLQAGAGNIQQLMQSRNTNQEFGFRERAADVDVPFSEGQRALMGVASGPVEAVGSGQGMLWDRFADDPMGSAMTTPGTEASIRQRDAAASLSAARESWGPQAGVTIQMGGLGDQFDPYDTGRGTVLPDVGAKGYSRATGFRGALTNLANIASNLVRGELTNEQANLARQGMEQFATRMRAAGRVLMGISHGKITNQQMAESGIYAVDPTDIFRGDQMALNRAQSSSNTLRRELTKQNMLLQAAKPQSTQWNNLYSNILTLQDALADNEFLVSMFGKGLEGAAAPEEPDVPAPPGVDPEDWRFMSPEDRALWTR